MKNIMVALVALVCVSANAAQINWGDTSVPYFLDGTDTAIAGGAGLVQLVFVGVDGIADWGDLGGGSDDVIVDFGPMGQGGGKASAGKFVSAYAYAFDAPYGNGDSFYIRFFDTADGLTGDFGVVGLSAGGTVGSATLFSIAATDDTGIDSFLPTVTSADMAVPEPGTIALALAGLGALVARRRKNRK